MCASYCWHFRMRNHFTQKRLNIKVSKERKKEWKKKEKKKSKEWKKINLFICLQFEINSLFCSAIYNVQCIPEYIVFLPDIISNCYNFFKHFIMRNLPVSSFIYCTYFKKVVLSAYFFVGEANVEIIHSIFVI